MPATVRPLITEDAPAVAVLEALCNPLPWHLEDVLPFADWEKDPGASSFVRVGLVARAEDGRIVGYLLASLVAGEAEILILGVHPDARRKGIARDLLRGLFAHLKTLSDPFVAESVFLEVRRGNDAAIRLYEFLGFYPNGVRKGYYADSGEDAVLLRKELST